MKAANRYRLDMRDLRFVLFEQFKLGELLAKAPYEAWGEEEVEGVVRESARFAQEVLGPLNAVGDRQGCHLRDGRVTAPPGFKQAWDQVYELGFKTLDVPVDHGGQGAPKALQVVVEELLAGANSAFAMYPALTAGAVETIAAFGTPEQHQRFLEPMHTGRWAGTTTTG